MEETYASVEKKYFDDFMAFLQKLVNAGTDVELAVDFYDEFNELLELYIGAVMVCDSYVEAIDEYVPYHLRKKIEDRYQVLLDERIERTLNESDAGKKEDNDENKIFDPRKYLKLVKD